MLTGQSGMSRFPLQEGRGKAIGLHIYRAGGLIIKLHTVQGFDAVVPGRRAMLSLAEVREVPDDQQPGRGRRSQHHEPRHELAVVRGWVVEV